MAVLERAIGLGILAELEENGSVERAERKEIGPPLERADKRGAGILKSIELEVGKCQVVLHLRRLGLEFGGSLQGLEGVFQVAVLGVDGAQRHQLFGVVGIVELVASRARVFSRTLVELLAALDAKAAFAV